MSLLANESYANSSRNLWFPVTGGTISGNVTVNGTLSALTVRAGDFVSPDASGNTILRMTNSFGDSYLQSPSNIRFGQIGQSATNTSLTLSAPGANLDAFTTNFLYAIGPVPTNLITSSKTINPVPTSPPQAFLVDTPYPTVVNQVYDVQATGILSLVSGTPDPADSVRFDLDAGTGTSITSYTYYPSGPNQSGTWSLRQRIVANAVQPSIAVLVSKLLAGISTAVYSATINYFSVVRVA